ncbi:MAG: bifunctional oligoribonuclease/PAP phosphatase NrnA [bacterium]
MNFLKKLVQIIKKSKQIVIATHIDPDADGISAALSCGYLVEHFKRIRPKLYCYSPIPRKYAFILGNWKFARTLPEFDLLIAVDSAGISRIFPGENELSSKILGSKFIVNIDHHKSNEAFGTLRIVQEDVSSACEIIYTIFQGLRITIKKPLAEIFYCGIYSETGGFVYPNTTHESLKMASELVGLGVEPGPISKQLNAKSLSGTLLLSEVLKTIEIENSVGTMCLTQKMLKKCSAKITDSEHFVSFLQAINNVRVSIFLREEKNGTRVSLRSDGVMDVDKLAGRFGGGGHRLAAGVRVKMPIKLAKKELLRAVRQEFQKQSRRK